MKTVAYLRVSTDKQDFDAQREAIGAYCSSSGVSIDEWKEVEISSRKSPSERGVDRLIGELESGDCLVVSELSRLARSVGEISVICDRLVSGGIRLICIKEGINLKKNGKDLDVQSLTMVTMFGLFAQIERTLIRQRVVEGVAAAKARGVRFGNPNLPQQNRKAKKEADKFAAGLSNKLNKMLDKGMTQREIVYELNRRNITARKGGKWTLLQLQKVLARIERNNI